jgi:acetolactate synthase I/II/III large subunit
VDAGAHMLPAIPLWQTDEARSVLISNGLATMGFSIPAAIGLALARPGRRVACLVGDGGLGMVLAELETIARLGLDITVVVLNDATLSLIKLKQGEGQGGESAVDYGLIDFAQVASGLGLPSTVVTSAAELKGALEALSDGPTLIDARIDAAAYPHIISTIRGR